MIKPVFTLTALAIATTLPLASLAAEHITLQVGAEQRDQLSLTLYNQNLGLVRETRQLPILQNGQTVVVEDVSAMLQPQTLQLGNAGKIIEQNHNTDLLSYHRLLEYHIGKQVQLAERNPATGQETSSPVTLLSMQGNQALIERNQQIESIPLNGDRRFIFSKRPDNLTLKPSIGFRSEGTDKAQKAEISYLTGGLSWQMDYVLRLNKAGDKASLSGMATLSNQTGSHFPNANISLLAGTVNQPNPPVMRRKAEAYMAGAMAMQSDSAAPQRQQLQDFHLYTLPKRVDLKNNQQKQVSLMSAENLQVQRIHELNLTVSPRPQPERLQLKPSVQLTFINSEQNGLGEPMPAGTVRVFSPDSTNQLQFIGGSNTGNSARDEKVEIALGQAFDVSVNQQQTSFEKTYDGIKSGQSLTIKNSADRPATLKLRTYFHRRWEMEQNSEPFSSHGNSAVWQLTVPANGESTLSFQVKLFDK